MRKQEILRRFINNLDYWLRNYDHNFTLERGDNLTTFQIRDSSGKPAYSVRIYPEECMAFFEDTEDNVISLFHGDRRRIREDDAYSAAVSVSIYAFVRNKGHKVHPRLLLDMMRRPEEEDRE